MEDFLKFYGRISRMRKDEIDVYRRGGMPEDVIAKLELCFVMIQKTDKGKNILGVYRKIETMYRDYRYYHMVCEGEIVFEVNILN